MTHSYFLPRGWIPKHRQRRVFDLFRGLRREMMIDWAATGLQLLATSIVKRQRAALHLVQSAPVAERNLILRACGARYRTEHHYTRIQGTRDSHDPDSHVPRFVTPCKGPHYGAGTHSLAS